MGEAILKKSVQTNFSDQIIENPTNLLQRFSPEKPNQTPLSNFEHQQQLLDLNLKLSLGGLYGEKPITRSSSVAGLVTKKIINAGESDSALPGIFLSLTRSCSLPTETEQGQLKLKELQAKKRVLVDKQRRGGATPEEENYLAEVVPQASLAAWAAASAAKSPALCRAIVQIKTQGYVSKKRRLEEGLESMAAGKDAISSQSLPNPKDGAAVIPGAAANGKSVKLENSSKRIEVSNGRIQHNGMDVMKQMPSVTTTGDGPNGKRIEGFLYKYMKGQVSIVCVCHGSFLSPAEFVRHAGGRDVENPMKHINVCHTF